jgi:hypothetical protein
MNKKPTRKQLLASIQRKEADLDMLDDQILSLPSAAPEFDTLSQKRQDLEEDIRKMQESVQVVNEWEAFKGGDWSDDMKQKLNGLDSQFSGLVSNDYDANLDTGSTPPPISPMDSAPPAPVEPPPAISSPEPTPDLSSPPPADDNDALNAPDQPDTSLDSPDSSLPTDTGVIASWKSTLRSKNSKEATASTTKGDVNMSTPGKSPLKERIADLRQTREQKISREAQTRVASTWTVAKTMLPGAPVAQQMEFAKALLANTTLVIKAVLRQTAKNMAFQKVCEELSSIHKVEMNDLLEDPSVLTKATREVVSELKGEAKNAKPKKADDRKECGTLPEAYPEPKRSEPSEIDAGKAGDRPENTVNMSEGDKKASKKKACGKDCKGCPECDKEKKDEKKASVKKACSKKCTGKTNCAGCKLAAIEAKIADARKKFAEDAPPPPPPPPAPEGEDTAPEGEDMPPADDEAPFDDMPADDEAPADDAEGEEVETDSKKIELNEKIQTIQQDIAELAEAINEEGNEELDLTGLNDEDADAMPEDLEEGHEEGLGEEGHEEDGQELDLNSIFNDDNFDEKVSALANEDDDDMHHEAAEDFFAPTSAAEMEEGLEDDGYHTAGVDMFDMQGASADPMAFLTASTKYSYNDTETVVEPGKLLDAFGTDAVGKDDRDFETDHESTPLADILNSLDMDDYDSGKRDTTSNQKAPSNKEAGRKKAGMITKIKVQAPAPVTRNFASLLFNDDDM